MSSFAIREKPAQSQLAKILLLACSWFHPLKIVSGSGTCSDASSTEVSVGNLNDLLNAIACANTNTESTYTLTLRASITLNTIWGSQGSQARSGLWIGPSAKVSIKGNPTEDGTSQIVRSRTAEMFRLFYVSTGAHLSMENIDLRLGAAPCEFTPCG